MIGFRISFEISAIFICALCLLFMRINVKHVSDQDRVYKILLWTLIFACLFNICCNVIEENAITSLYFLQNPLQTLYFLMHNVQAPFYLLYVMVLNGSINRRKQKRILLMYMIPFGLSEMICLSNPWTEVVFAYENGVYTKHLFSYVLFAVSMLYVFLALIVFVQYRKGLSVHLVRRIGAASVVVLLGIFVQTMFRKVNIEMFSESLLSLTILITLVIGGRDKDPVTGLPARSGILGEMRRREVAKVDYDLLILKLHNLLDYQNISPIREWNDFMVEFAEWLSTVGSGAIPMRYGEEKFVIFFNRKQTGEMNRIVEEVRNGISRSWYLGDAEMHLEGEIFYARVPDQIPSAEDLDVIMGLPRPVEPIVVHDFSEFAFLRTNKEVQAIIKKALAEDRVVAYYQPIVDAKTEQVVSAEALARIVNEDGSILSPGIFIPVAEQTGQIIEIGDRIIKKVCELMGKHQLEKKGIPCVELNLSAKQIPNKELIPNFEKYILDNGLKSSNINLEITESEEADREMLDSVMKKFREMGTGFSLDDFGTGYSNFSRLLDEPFINVKFDKSLLDKAGKDEKDRILYENLIRMVRKMDFRIVQEGVETKEQAEYVSGLGCEYIQGFYYSRPLPEQEFLSYVEKSNTEGMSDHD